MRKALFALPAALVLALAPAGQAQAKWPDKPVKIVLPFGAGGVADVTARILADKLSQKFGERVVIENMPGPGGINAALTVVKAPCPTATPWASSPTAPRSASPRSRSCRSTR